MVSILQLCSCHSPSMCVAASAISKKLCQRRLLSLPALAEGVDCSIIRRMANSCLFMPVIHRYSALSSLLILAQLLHRTARMHAPCFAARSKVSKRECTSKTFFTCRKRERLSSIPVKPSTSKLPYAIPLNAHCTADARAPNYSIVSLGV